jgi:flagellar basal-body rod protein FlgC
MSSGMFESLRVSATGMSSQRVKMDVVAQNIANAETTRTADGTPYRRQRAVFQQLLERKLARLQLQRSRSASGAGGLSRTNERHLPGGLQLARQEGSEGVRVDVGRAPDASDFRVVFDPGHPDADAEGYVLLPNVNVISEMVDMITASRAYEANVSAVQAAKDMFAKALEI